MNAAAVVLVGALVGAVVGVVWAWLGSGGYEAGDSMVGTGFLGGLGGALGGVVVVSLRRRR